jgi:hypothetical protein
MRNEWRKNKRLTIIVNPVPCLVPRFVSHFMPRFMPCLVPHFRPRLVLHLMPHCVLCFELHLVPRFMPCFMLLFVPHLLPSHVPCFMPCLEPLFVPRFVPCLVPHRTMTAWHRMVGSIPCTTLCTMLCATLHATFCATLNVTPRATPRGTPCATPHTDSLASIGWLDAGNNQQRFAFEPQMKIRRSKTFMQIRCFSTLETQANWDWHEKPLGKQNDGNPRNDKIPNLKNSN